MAGNRARHESVVPTNDILLGNVRLIVLYDNWKINQYVRVGGKRNGAM